VHEVDKEPLHVDEGALPMDWYLGKRQEAADILKTLFLAGSRTDLTYSKYADNKCRFTRSFAVLGDFIL
jgi:hypothetical protein